MIEVLNYYDTTKMVTWLERDIKPFLTNDVSSYARGRARAWLGTEPMLFAPFKDVPAVQVHSTILPRLREIIDWDFHYCLVTFSGERATGISPHRDAGYADYEAYGLNIIGDCTFSYWNDRRYFGQGPSSGLAPATSPPTDVLKLQEGHIFHFNCKNLHSAEPSPNRWGMNFWRRTTKR
jgi:hypothetical protein